MPDRIIHLRNLTPGAVPASSSFGVGELAINVNDGKIFLRQSGSYGDTVQTAVTTNNVTTGSITISGSLTLTGSLYALNYQATTDPNQLFLIKSASTTYFNVSSSGNIDLYSNIFYIRNFTTNQPVLTVTESIVQFATQSTSPTGTAPNGAIWFTATNMFIGID